MSVLRRRLAVLLVALGAFHVPFAAAAQGAREHVDVLIADGRAAMLVDPAQARTKAQQAEREIASIADPNVRGRMEATALWLQGEAAYRLQDLAVASSKLQKAMALARQYAPGSRLEGDVLLSSGSVDGETGKIVAALGELQRAHAIFLRNKEMRSRVIALSCIASLYTHAKDYSAALRYYDQALAGFSGDPALRVSILNNRAVTLRAMGRYAEAESQFRAALAIADTMRSNVLKAQIVRNIAWTQLKQNDVEGAFETLKRGDVAVRRADPVYQQAAMAVAAQAALQAGRTGQAAALIEQSFAHVNLDTTSFGFRDAHETAYQVFHKLGRDNEAFAHLLAVKRLDDEVTEVATSTSAALMTARFDFANQELRIARLKAEDLSRRVEAARTQARVQRYIFYGGAGTTAIVIGALLIGLIVVRRSRDKVRAANTDLGFANAALGKALAAKTEFLATTSHEIRTPLNGILGMTQVMLADPTLPEAMRDRLSVVQGAGTTMRALVDDILDVAKMENGKLVLEDAPFDLKATILDATRLWDVQAGAKGIVFRRMLDDCPAIVSGDAGRVRQVVFNLLSNALKFTDAGEIAIAARQQPDGQVAIAVSDSGVGIPADKLEAIFESFRQADAGTTRRFGGTGLGLAICRQLARAMGGDVTVDSAVGRGSVFTVTLPLVTVAEDAGHAADVRAPALLVLERNPIARSLLRTLLQPHAERIVFAGDVAEAVAALADPSIAQVLLDDATVRAAGDSQAALRAITGAAGAGVSVTLLSPAVDDAERQALLATGIDCILTKPVSGPSLVATLFRQGDDPLVRRAA